MRTPLHLPIPNNHLLVCHLFSGKANQPLSLRTLPTEMIKLVETEVAYSLLTIVPLLRPHILGTIAWTLLDSFSSIYHQGLLVDPYADTYYGPDEELSLK